MKDRIEYQQFLINQLIQLENNLEYTKTNLYSLELDTTIAMIYLSFSGYVKKNILDD